MQTQTDSKQTEKPSTEIYKHINPSSLDKIVPGPANISNIYSISNALIENEAEPNKPTNKTITSFYTKYNFIPLNLYVQFSKLTNLFFLSVLILLLIPAISPFSAYTYILALLIVILASMIKDGIEDKKRHEDDYIINKNPVKSIRVENDEIKIVEKPTENVHKDEFLLLTKGDEIPADGIIILSFSAIKYNQENFIKDGVEYKSLSFKQECKDFSYIETSKIDGETAWKKKYSNLQDEPCKCKESVYIKKSELKKITLPYCLKKILLKIGNLKVSTDSILSLEFSHQKHLERKANLVLRGMIVKSENVVILIYRTHVNKEGVGIKTLTKTSTFTKKMEQCLYAVFGIFFAFLISSLIFLPSEISQPFYFIKGSDVFRETIKLMLTNYTILSFVVPLSLCVMLEVARIFFKLYTQNLLAFCKTENTDLSINSWNDLINLNKNVIGSITVRNTEIIEQLGSTETIVTDKTGTLTLNKMVFKYIYIHERKNEILPENILEIEKLSEETRENTLAILLLLCCNSVYISKEEVYGTSTDELSIVKKLLSLKNNYDENMIRVIEKDDKMVNIVLFDNKVEIDILKILEFSSKRRKMAVLIKITKITSLIKNARYDMLIKLQENYMLLTKGSRNAVFCDALEIPKDFIHLRELVLSYKFIDREDVLQIIHETENKTEGVRFEEIYKSKQNFLGITLVEDTLQPDLLRTLSLFRDIFIITGDTKGTAIGVANSMKMKVIWAKTFVEIKEEDIKIIPDKLRYPYKYFIKESEKYDACADEEIYNTIELDSEIECKIFYNVLPEQKGEIVKKIQQHNSNVLAIGDGFNDIPMLKEASIGVGLKGEEGSAASNTADISVSAFNCLIPLVYMSRQAYLGFAYLTFNAIMKNIYLMGIQMLLFILTNGSIFNSEFLAWFNVLFTSSITFSEACGGRALVFNKEKRERFLQKIKPENWKSNNLFPNLLQDPSLRPIFSHTKCNHYFSFKKFVIWLLFSVLKSIVVFVTTFYMFNQFKILVLETIGIIFTYIVFFGVIAQQLSTITNWNYFLVFWICFGFCAFFAIIRSFYIFKYFLEIACIVSLGILVDIIRAVVIEWNIES
ncbi:putative phospholipid-transporting ATPase [Cucumispora dikerogammari]|nr:putative phospholipid-transporting ATPase [Cucumispora dikerogammari]